MKKREMKCSLVIGPFIDDRRKFYSFLETTNFDAHARVQKREMNYSHVTGAFVDGKRKINGFLENTN